MKKLVIALTACASFSAMASNVGTYDSNTMRGNVNLECSTSNGDILEVSGYDFPQNIEIQSDYYSLNQVKKIDGQKVYFYKEIKYPSLRVYALIVGNNGSTSIQDQHKHVYTCE